MFVAGKVEDGNAVIQLQSKGVDQIVDDDDITEIPVLDDPQILDAEALLGLKTMISAQNPLNSFSLCVEMGHNCLSVIFSGSCENVYFEEMAHPL